MVVGGLKAAGEIAELGNKIFDSIQSANQLRERKRTEAERHERTKELHENPVWFIIDYFDADGLLSEISEAEQAAKTDEADFIKFTHNKKRVSIETDKLQAIISYLLLLENQIEDM